MTESISEVDGAEIKGDPQLPRLQICILRPEPPPVGAVRLGESPYLTCLGLGPSFENGVDGGIGPAEPHESEGEGLVD